MTVTLSEPSLLLDRYETATLTATVKDKDGNPVSEAVTWSSDNESVASVSGGVVEAKGEGSANITAKVGDASATCLVDVENSGALPVLDTGDESVELIVGASYTVSAAVVYKRTEQTDAKVTYTAQDPSIVDVDENGKITAKKFGRTGLTVKGDWRGIESPYLTETVDVNVKEDVVVTVDRGSATIFTLATTVDGQEFTNEVTLGGTVNVNGADGVADGGTLTWKSSDETVATVDQNGKVTANTAKKEGIANITLNYDSGNRVYESNPVAVTVKFPTVDKSKQTLAPYTDASKGTLAQALNADEIFGEDSGKTITRVCIPDDLGTDILNDSDWLERSDDGFETARKTKITVYNEDYAYTIQTTIVTKIISDYSELTQMQQLGNVSQDTATVSGRTFYNWSGMFILGNDIVVPEGAEQLDVKGCDEGFFSGGHFADNVGFLGVFDGRGHTIHGLKLGFGGLFGVIGNKDGTMSVIKNVALTDVVVDNAANKGGGALCQAFINGDLYNVFVSFSINGGYHGALGRGVKGGRIRNTLIYYNKSGGYTCGAVTSWSVAQISVTNMVVVYSKSLSTNKTPTDVDKNGNLTYNDVDRKLNGQMNGSTNVALNTSTKVVEVNEEDFAKTTFKLGNTYADYYCQVNGLGTLPLFTTSVSGVSIDKNELTLAVGATENNTLVGSVLNLAGTAFSYVPVIWSSSDESVATVSGGVVTAVAAGTATITASYGTHTATCSVTVTA